MKPSPPRPVPREIRELAGVDGLRGARVRERHAGCRQPPRLIPKPAPARPPVTRLRSFTQCAITGDQAGAMAPRLLRSTPIRSGSRKYNARQLRLTS